MRILVYPHSMEIGGSQLNAIEIAGAVRDRGHDVVVYAEDGALVEHVHDLGLEHLPRRASRIRPGPATALDLRRLVDERGLDVVHGYEWPPILEGFAATSVPARRRGRAVTVGTVMSMAVAPFIPASVPLVVGTAQIQAHEQARRSGPVELLEPPVDTRANAPDGAYDAPPLPGLDPEALRVVIVSRLVRQLKLEGILTAVAAVGRLAERRRVQLVVVGDGDAGPEVRAAAARVNDRHGRPVVVMAGEQADPRWAYASADVCVGMGGSALRALAFAAPLVVQGEGGFFQSLTPETVDTFLRQGWYGQAHLDQEAATDLLVGLLEGLAADAAERDRRGRFGRDLVERRFSLEAAAEAMEHCYRRALAAPVGPTRMLADATGSGAGLVAYKARRRVDRWTGRVAVDDFNARPV